MATSDAVRRSTPTDQLTLRIWPGSGEWTLYEDDGHTFEYRNAAWATTTYRVRADGQQTIGDQGA